MASATDIITYVGIPLAVLGVLPILYTSILAILNQRRIRAALLHNGHKPIATSKREQDGFTIRSSPMTTLIEVELPKYAITPLERGDDRYWRLNRSETSGTREHDHLLERADSTLSTIEEGRVQGYLRGGSWRAFQWKKLVVGKKLYRIQYVDELREPPAEIDFTELIHFLLDWGVELDPMGWEKLRSGGLWTPAGTVLLKLPGDDMIKGHRDWVLRTSMPDESDGILSLCVRWPEGWQDVMMTRGATSLPPGWGRLCQPTPLRACDEPEEKKKDLATRIEDLKSTFKQALDSTSMRFKIDRGDIARIYWEQEGKETGTSTPILFQSKYPQSQAWFTTATSSLLLTKPTTNSTASGMLWGHEPPNTLTAFCQRDTIPVGVLVLLDILPSDKAPHWSVTAETPLQTSLNTAHEHMRKYEARRAAERLEASMPAAQAAIAKSNRQHLERMQDMDSMIAMGEARRNREIKIMQDALVSVRASTSTVASHCLAYLIEKGEIDREYTLYDVVEAVLYLLILDRGNDTQYQDELDAEFEPEAEAGLESEPKPSPSSSSHKSETKSEPESESQSDLILTILSEWQNWSVAGGMQQQQYDLLSSHKIEFCLAACLVGVVAEALSLGEWHSHSHGNGNGNGNGRTKGKGRVKGNGKRNANARASVDMLECLELWRKVRLG